MALDDVDVPQSPAWWMNQMSRRLLSRQRVMRLATLSTYLSGRPPVHQLARSEREGAYAFMRLARVNTAGKIVGSATDRMAIRSIRTAVVNDPNGDQVAWRYFTAAGLDIAQTDVHTDMLGLHEGYVRCGVNADGKPMAWRRDPRFIITVEDPLDPNRTLAAFELLYDELAGKDYAYLWLPGEQYVAERDRKSPPSLVIVPGTDTSARAWRLGDAYPRLTFTPESFTMRPNIDDVPAVERDNGPYSQTFSEKIVPVFRFGNRKGVSDFEEHLDLLDRINYTILIRVVTSAVQAYKQRALEQEIGSDGRLEDRLPEKDPKTGEPIDWDSLFSPGPDALWKLPPGVKIWESAAVDLAGVLNANKSDFQILSGLTGTPLNMFMSDSTHQTAEGVQDNKDSLLFRVKDRLRIAHRPWANVVACLFRFAEDADRYDGDGNDRADASRIIIDFEPPEQYSLAERAQADSQNKSLSADMAAEIIWGLTPDQVALNKTQRVSDLLIAAPALNDQSASG